MSSSSEDDHKSNYSKSSSKKRGGSGTSFRNVGNDIIHEGKIPSSNNRTNRPTILGTKPSNLGMSNDNLYNTNASSNGLKRNLSQNQKTSSKKNLINSQRRINDDNQSVDSIYNDNKNRMKEGKVKQDILTKQAIDDVKDHIELFKMDINKYISQLKEQQEKIDLGDVKEDIKILEDSLDKDLKDARLQSDKELTVIKEQFFQFKERVFDLISKIAKENEGKISKLYDEIRKYEDIVSQQFSVIQDKQEEYINLLKLILETTKDTNTKIIVEQFLVNDQEIFENNKERYEREFNEKQEKIKKKKEEKERKQVKSLLEDEIKRLETEAKQREQNEITKKQYELMKDFQDRQKLAEERELERMKKLEEIERYLRQKADEDEYTNIPLPIINPRPRYPRDVYYEDDYYEDDDYSRDRPRRKKKKRKEKEKETESIKSKEKEKEKDKDYDRDRNRDNKIDIHFDGFYPPNYNPYNNNNNNNNQPIRNSDRRSEKRSEYSDRKKLKKKNEDDEVKIEEKKENLNENPKLTALKKFANVYVKGENQLIKLIRSNMKGSLYNLIQSISLDITQDKLNGNKENDRIVREKISLLNEQVKSFLNQLVETFNNHSLPEETKQYMKLLFKDNTFVPYKYFSLFELSRMSTNDGYIRRIDPDGKRMIVAFHIILKLLVKNYLTEYSFVKDNESVLDDLSKKNFKIVASIIYNEVIQLFKEKCHISNKITDLQKFISDQSDNDPELRDLLYQLNDRIMSGYPDDNEDNIAYVVDRLYTPEQLDLYYNNNKEKVDVKKYVLDFTDQFINLVQN